MCFSRQHKARREIVQKRWTILTDDSKVKSFVTDCPSITYKRATSIQDLLVQSEFKNAQKRDKHCPAFGTFSCGQCSFCSLMRKKKVFRLPNGDMFKPSHFKTARQEVHFIEGECGAYYVGKTKQEFWRRVSKHKYSMDIYYLPIGRHVAFDHNFNV